MSTNIFCLSARNRKRKNCKRLGCVQPRLSSVWHTGLSGGAPDSVRCARLARAKWPLSGIHRRRTAIIHRTVRCAPDCPVSQRSAGPTVGRAIGARHVAEPTVGRGHRTVRCAPDMSGAPTAPRSATVGCAILGRKSGTGLSGAPHDRRQELPSQIVLNGS